jgi:hypothetical protein
MIYSNPWLNFLEIGMRKQFLNVLFKKSFIKNSIYNIKKNSYFHDKFKIIKGEEETKMLIEEIKKNKVKILYKY